MDKKRNKWKKIIGIVLLFGVLLFSFWYGGNAPGLQGFKTDVEVSDVNDNSDDKTLSEGKQLAVNDKLSVENKDDASDLADKEGKDLTGQNKQDKNIKDKKKSGFFEQIVMRVKRLSSSEKSKKNNPQLNKKAQKNANKSVEKSTKNNKKKNASQSSQKGDTQIADNKTVSSENEKTATSKESTIDEKDKAELGESADSSDLKDDNEVEDNSTDSNKSKNENNAKDSNDINDDSKTITCNIYISCASVLDHMDKLTDATQKVIPEDGVVLNLTTVKIKSGATVFDVLQKAARNNKVHLEYNYTPAYKTYYIEGIGNLYQFDAGNLSGWLYSVNDKFPGIGCSSYKVKDGDTIKWLYTCDFGKDVGGYVEDK